MSLNAAAPSQARGPPVDSLEDDDEDESASDDPPESSLDESSGAVEADVTVDDASSVGLVVEVEPALVDSLAAVDDPCEPSSSIVG